MRTLPWVRIGEEAGPSRDLNGSLALVQSQFPARSVQRMPGSPKYAIDALAVRHRRGSRGRVEAVEDLSRAPKAAADPVDRTVPAVQADNRPFQVGRRRDIVGVDEVQRRQG